MSNYRGDEYHKQMCEGSDFRHGETGTIFSILVLFAFLGCFCVLARECQLKSQSTQTYFNHTKNK